MLALFGVLACGGCAEQNDRVAVDAASDAGVADALGPDVGIGDLAPPTDAAVVYGERDCRSQFRFEPAQPVAEVRLIGEWDWSLSPELKDDDGDGVYELSQTLPPGSWAYRFRLLRSVGGAEEFVLDPENPYRRYHGGVENSAARVPNCAEPLLVRRSFTLAGVAEQTTINAEVAFLRGRGGRGPRRFEAVLVHEGVRRVLSGAEATLQGDTIAIALSKLPLGKYTLRVEAGDQDGQAAEPLLFPFWVEKERFDWRDATIYMVMVDRFRDGDPQNNPAPAPQATPSADYRGGDLAGLLAAIESGYFDKLGVRAIWVSPLNANSDKVYVEHGKGVSGYHGYWPIKAREIDRRLGTAAELEAVVQAAHRRGMRVLLDWVINHLHEDHEHVKAHPEWFRKGCLCGETGCDWTARRLDCLFGAHLPDVNWEHPAGGEQQIADALWWVERFDLDGLRVDAVKHVEDLAVKNLSTRIHERFEQGGTEYFLLGETAMGWGGHDVKDSEKEYETISRYIGKYGLNGQFDFVLYHATAYRVFAYDEEGMVHVDYWTRQSLAHYPEGAVMTPYIGSHDTSRFLSQASYRGQDASHPAQIASNKWATDTGGLPQPPTQDEPYHRARVALTWLLTQPGAPLLYYGDEYGEYGGADPDNRHMFRAQSARSPAEKALFAQVQKVAQARRDNIALRRGSYRSVTATSAFLLFARVHAKQTVLVAINRSGATITPQVSLPADLQLGGAKVLRRLLEPAQPPLPLAAGVLQLTLPARSALILTP
jgi:glycosidase